MDADPREAARPDVTVVLATHNRQALLAEAVRSVSQQDWPSWECIVVDDGSEPPVSLPVADPRVEVIRRPESGGPAAARNTGLRAATGRYVAFLDDDDVMPPWRIRVGVESLRANPERNCHVGTLIRMRTPDLHSVPTNGEQVSERQLRTGTPSIEMLLVERHLVVEFDEALRVSEDVDWWLRMRSSVVPVMTDDVVAVVRIHDTSRTGVSPEVRFRARLRTYQKNRHRLPHWGEERSRYQRRVAESALDAGHSSTAARFAFAAFTTNPSLRKARLFLLSFADLVRGVIKS